MKKIQILITAVFMLIPLSGISQNWMMAQQYATAAIDSVINSGKDETYDFGSYNYSHFTYNPVTREYSLYLTDNFSPDSISSGNAVINVNLMGGSAVFTDDFYDSFEVSVPDWSDCVYIWNGTDSDISFSLSCDDTVYESYKLDQDSFNRYQCDAEYIYIRIITQVKGIDKGQVHYKLIKGKGYRVQYDDASAQFDVFEDDRLK